MFSERLTCDDRVTISPWRLRRLHRFVQTALLKLIQTLFDIALLRRGPQDLPKSWLVLYATVTLWFGGILLTMMIRPELSFAGLGRDVAGWLASLGLFTVIISAAGRSDRILQALSAIVGAGAVIMLGQILTDLLSILFNNGGNLLVRDLLLLWAVFVKGYILAAALGVKAIVGVLISVAVFVARIAVSQSLA